MEQDKQKEREKSLEGKFFTTKASSKNNLVLIKKNSNKNKQKSPFPFSDKIPKELFFSYFIIIDKINLKYDHLTKSLSYSDNHKILK